MSTPTPDHRDGAHFPGCHPEHDTDTREVPAGYQPARRAAEALAAARLEPEAGQ
jgi:hypothetical protein